MKKLLCLILAMAMALSMAACGGSNEEPAGTNPKADAVPSATQADSSAAPTEAVGTDVAFNSPIEEALGYNCLITDNMLIYGAAPTRNGHDVVDGAALAQLFTADEVAQIKSGDYTAYFVTCDNSSQWGISMTQSITDGLAAMGIKLLGVADAAHDQATLNEMIESAIALKPDVLICEVIDPDATKAPLDMAREAGIKLVLRSQTPADYVVNQDFYGCTISDDYTMVYLGAKAMCETIQEGKVAYFVWGTVNEMCQQRIDGFAAACAEYPGIELLELQYCNDMGQVAQLAESLYQAHPDLKGIGGHWDEVAVTAINAIEGLGGTVAGGCSGISENSALSCIRGKGKTGFVSGGAECPVEMGATSVLLTCGALLEKEMPYFIGSQTILWNLENMPEAWALSYGIPLYDKLQVEWDKTQG